MGLDWVEALTPDEKKAYRWLRAITIIMITIVGTLTLRIAGNNPYWGAIPASALLGGGCWYLGARVAGFVTEILKVRKPSP